MPPINFLSSVAVAIAFAFVARGFWPLMRPRFTDFSFHMMRGVFLFAVVVIARSVYWDVMQVIAMENWPTIRDALGGQKFSTAFNLPLLFCAYDFLYARWLLIPESERSHWRWWNAWMHPSRLCIIRWRK